MNEPSSDVKAWALMKTDDEFLTWQTSTTLEDRLHQLTEKHYLSDTELVEETNIKTKAPPQRPHGIHHATMITRIVMPASGEDDGPRQKKIEALHRLIPS